MEPHHTRHTAEQGLDGIHPCPQCGAEAVATIHQEDAFDYGSGESAVTLRVRIPVRCCRACAFKHLDAEAERVSHETACRYLGVLTSTEIRRIREQRGMSHAEFAQLTGLDEATLNCWENGAVIQNRAYDHLLRSLEAPEILNSLKSSQTAQGLLPV